MHISEAVRIANERRAARGEAPITVISSKKSPEFAETYKIMNESVYARIHSALSRPDPQADKKAELRVLMAGRAKCVVST